MRTSRVLGCLVTIFCWNLLVPQLGASAQNVGEPGEPTEATIPLTDPGRPAVVSVNAFLGDIVVRGMGRADVLVRNPQPRGSSWRRQTETPPGMRRLTPPSGLVIEERNNEINIESPCAEVFAKDPPSSPTPNPTPAPRGFRLPPIPDLPKLKGVPCGGTSKMDLQIEVPLRTRLKISTMSGDISVEAVDGIIEVNTLNGDVELTGVAGAVVANSVAGNVTATLTRVDTGAPMSFTSLNGDIDVTLPAAVKTNLKLRTLSGDMFTDFDLPAIGGSTGSGGRQPDGRFRFEVERAVTGALNGGGSDIELRTFAGDIYLRRGK